MVLGLCFAKGPHLPVTVMAKGFQPCYATLTSPLPPTRGCPQVSLSPVLMTGIPPARTVPLPFEVTAWQCMGGHPLRPQQGCAVTRMLLTTMGRPLTRTDPMPLVATPPAELASPCLCAAGIHHPIKILLDTGFIPVVASM